MTGDAPRLHAVRAGSGPGVLLLHAGAGSHLQWLPHMHALSREHVCVAPDLLGHGASPSPAGLTPATIVDAHLAAFDRLLADLEGPVHVVGHSFGAALGLAYALARPSRVSSLLLVEPPLFRLLDTPADASLLAEVERVEVACLAALAAGDPMRASELFSRYWSGDRLWDELPLAFRHLLAEGARARHEIGIAAMFFWDLPADAARRLDGRRVTLLGGALSPRPARRMLERLAERLPEATRIEVPDAGHLLPSTHPQAFRPLLRAHLAQSGTPP